MHGAADRTFGGTGADGYCRISPLEVSISYLQSCQIFEVEARERTGCRLQKFAISTVGNLESVGCYSSKIDGERGDH